LRKRHSQITCQHHRSKHAYDSRTKPAELPIYSAGADYVVTANKSVTCTFGGSSATPGLE